MKKDGCIDCLWVENITYQAWSSRSSWWCAHGIPTERIPIGIRSVGKYSGHHHHHHHHHHCHHCSVPFSLFMKWSWPNQLVLLIYTNWREPSAHAECADHKSEFSKMVKVDQIQPGAKKNYNCNQCGYSVPNFPIWKLTCELTAERNPLFVHSATTLAIKLAGLESTCESTLEKSLIIGQ